MEDEIAFKTKCFWYDTCLCKYTAKIMPFQCLYQLGCVDGYLITTYKKGKGVIINAKETSIG